tara:strand:+ start:5119 stop:6201 length:1083 start_codon:yes stop_codon:yes gene_type:complete
MNIPNKLYFKCVLLINGMNFKIYLHLFNIISSFCLKQPIPFADSSLSKQGIHKIPIPVDTTFLRPLSVDHNNENVAVWWNAKEQNWNAVSDMCPHRQASLSSGIINPITNDIKCRYHGIEFNGCGKCTLIPSSNYNKNIFSVKKYYIKEKYNLLWIDDTDDSELPFIEVLEEKNEKFPWNIYKTDISSMLLVENFLDSIHVDHVHHGMLPTLDRYYKLPDYSSSKINWFNETGFSCNITAVEITYLSQYEITTVKAPIISIISMTIPYNSTHISSISTLLFELNDKYFIRTMITKIFVKLIAFYIKLRGSDIFNQDVYIIKTQEENIKKYGKKTVKSGPADLPMILYNRWLKKYGVRKDS